MTGDEGMRAPAERPTTATGSPSVAVAHYPEGAGHATRMLAVAEELESRGAEVRMAGGGAGTQFVALNGYDEFEPTTVDYIDSVQEGSIRQVLAGSVPASANRVADYVGWLRETTPDALVTDDMFAAMAALRVDVPLYVLKHDMPALYRNRLERAGAAFHTDFQVAAAREFFYPAVWPAAGLAPEGATRVPPVSLEGSGRDRDGADVVLVPSYYSDLDRIATTLEREGHDVINVGSDDWEPVPSLLPYLRDAEVVVCSGYSTVMDAAVAGTPCVVYPATDEQEAVADRLRGEAAPGFVVAEEPRDVLDAVSDPPDPPAFENGAPRIATAILDDLQSAGRSRTSDGLGTSLGVHDPLAAATGVLLGGRTNGRRARRRSGARQGVRAVARTVLAAGNGRRSAGTSIRETVRALLAAGRATARTARRYALATSTLLAAVLLFADCRLRRTGDAAIAALAALIESAAARFRAGLAAGARLFARVGSALAAGAARSGRALRDAIASSIRK